MHSHSTRAVALLIASNYQYVRFLLDVIDSDCDAQINADRARDGLARLLQMTLEHDAVTLGTVGRDAVGAACIFDLVFAAVNDADWLWIIAHLPAGADG